MKSIRNVFSSLFILVGFVALISLLHAQETATSVQEGTISSVSMNDDVSGLSDLEVEEKAIETTTPVAAANVPVTATFYSAKNPDWPPLPGNIRGVPIWPVGDGLYLLDDL